jgi:glycosyltransferase involved in cell wall biosynthesis
VVPVYNERQSLIQSYEELLLVLEGQSVDFELIFVDDGSTDGSRERLQELAREDRRVKLLCFDQNYGQTAAMLAGFHSARGEVIVPLDADLQNDPFGIPRLLQKLSEGYDIVSGWRRSRQDAWIRVLPSRVANLLISWVGGLRLHDYGCTMKAYRSEWVRGLDLRPGMHRFLPLFPFWRGAKVAELPVHHRPRAHGVSKYGMGRIRKVARDLVSLYRWRRQYQSLDTSWLPRLGWILAGLGAAGVAGAGLLLLVPESAFSSLGILLNSLGLIGCGFLLASLPDRLKRIVSHAQTLPTSEPSAPRYAIQQRYNFDEPTRQA